MGLLCEAYGEKQITANAKMIAAWQVAEEQGVLRRWRAARVAGSPKLSVGLRSTFLLCSPRTAGLEGGSERLLTEQI